MIDDETPHERRAAPPSNSRSESQDDETDRLTNAIRSASDTMAALDAARRHLDLKHATVMRSRANVIDGSSMRTTYPDVWLGRYFARNYVAVDPVSQQGYFLGRNALWSDLDWSNAAVLVEDAARHDIGRSGYTASHAHRGYLGHVSFASDDAPDDFVDRAARERPRWDRIARHLVFRLTRELDASSDGEVMRIGAELSDAPNLSPRELQCLERIANGLDTPAIAQHLGISQHTVRDHLKAARRKLGCATLAQTVHVATRLGLL